MFSLCRLPVVDRLRDEERLKEVTLVASLHQCYAVQDSRETVKAEEMQSERQREAGEVAKQKLCEQEKV